MKWAHSQNCPRRFLLKQSSGKNQSRLYSFLGFELLLSEGSFPFYGRHWNQSHIIYVYMYTHKYTYISHCSWHDLLIFYLFQFSDVFILLQVSVVYVGLWKAKELQTLCLWCHSGSVSGRLSTFSSLNLFPSAIHVHPSWLPWLQILWLAFPLLPLGRPLGSRDKVTHFPLEVWVAKVAAALVNTHRGSVMPFPWAWVPVCPIVIRFSAGKFLSLSG